MSRISLCRTIAWEWVRQMGCDELIASFKIFSDVLVAVAVPEG